MNGTLDAKLQRLAGRMLHSERIANFFYASSLGRFIFFASYSQTGEDALLRRWLPERTGTYVDVGAGLPIKCSNTYFLYRRGWSGLLIEPNPLAAQALRRVRKRDQILCSAMANEASTRQFFQFEPYELSTTDHEVAFERQASGERLLSVKNVECRRLRDVVPRCSPSEPTLLSIDAEGSDLLILKGNNWNKFLPRVICIEDPLSSFRTSKIVAYLNSNGYELEGHTGISAVFVHRDFER